MTPEEAREKIQGIVQDLEAIRSRLLSVEAGLPESSAETDPRDLEEMEDSAALRSAIRCALEDSIQPALRDLRNAAAPER